MPLIVRRDGFVIVIRTADHPPPHVHVQKAGTQAKIALVPIAVVLDNMAPRDLIRAVRLVEAEVSVLLSRWEEIHGTIE